MQLGEAVPLVGQYDSFNTDVMRLHCVWMLAAGVDGIVVDWTNNVWGLQVGGGNGRAKGWWGCWLTGTFCVQCALLGRGGAEGDMLVFPKRVCNVCGGRCSPPSG